MVSVLWFSPLLGLVNSINIIMLFMWLSDGVMSCWRRFVAVFVCIHFCVTNAAWLAFLIDQGEKDMALVYCACAVTPFVVLASTYRVWN